jgi:hypothetical protein
VTAYKEKKINQEDLEKIFTDMEESSAFIALSFYGIENDYLEGTDLSPKEIEQGKRSFQRAVRGLHEGKITEKDFLAALPEEEEIDIEQFNNKNINERVRQVANKKAQGSPDDDLRLTLVKLKNLADNARIPDEPFELHIGAEVKKLVDKHLAGK